MRVPNLDVQEEYDEIDEDDEFQPSTGPELGSHNFMRLMRHVALT